MEAAAEIVQRASRVSRSPALERTSKFADSIRIHFWEYAAHKSLEVLQSFSATALHHPRGHGRDLARGPGIAAKACARITGAGIPPIDRVSSSERFGRARSRRRLSGFKKRAAHRRYRACPQRTGAKHRVLGNGRVQCSARGYPACRFPAKIPVATSPEVHTDMPWNYCGIRRRSPDTHRCGRASA